MFSIKKTMLLMSVLLVNTIAYSMEIPDIERTETNDEIRFVGRKIYPYSSNDSVDVRYDKTGNTYWGYYFGDAMQGSRPLTSLDAQLEYQKLDSIWRKGAGG